MTKITDNINLWVNEIELRINEPHKWIFNDLSTTDAYCIECSDTPCMTLQKDEINNDAFSNMAVDPKLQVCISDAITKEQNQPPVINNNKCIMCGLCASRCPVKSIYFNHNLLTVNTKSDLQNPNHNIPQNVNIKGVFNNITQNTILKNHQKILEFIRINKDISVNLLVRNLLIGLGWFSSSYKQGVQYGAIDVVAFKDGNYIAAEIEISNALIDTPRNLIAGNAILNNRYQWKNTELLSIGVAFPNHREEFWNVIDDIEKILNISIKFITLPFLIYLIWLRKPLKPYTQSLAYSDNRTLRKALELNEHSEIKHGQLGILEPNK